MQDSRNRCKGVRVDVIIRDNSTCVYCGTVLRKSEIELDHIIPFSIWDCYELYNLACSCNTCNENKRDNLLDYDRYCEIQRKIGYEPIINKEEYNKLKVKHEEYKAQKAKLKEQSQYINLIRKYKDYFESWLSVPIEQILQNTGIQIFSNVGRTLKPDGWMTFIPVCGFESDGSLFISCIPEWEDEIRLLLKDSALSDSLNKIEQFSEEKTSLAFFNHAFFGLNRLNPNIDTTEVTLLNNSHFDAYIEFYRKANPNLCAIIDPYEFISEDFQERVDSKIHFCIFENDEMVSVTTSDNLPNKPTGLIQLGIDTLKDYRRKGYAEKVCAAFINYYE